MILWTMRSTRGRLWLTAIGVLVAAAALLLLPQAAAAGVRRGLAVCGSVVVPSLFPFLVLSGFAVRTGLCDRIGHRLGGVTRRLFRLPGCAAAAILIGMIGGYPAGAVATDGLVRSGRLTREEGQRLLLFSVNAGPAFVLGTVGNALLGSPSHGWLLLALHLGVSLLLGLALRGETAPCDETLPVSPLPSAGTALVESVRAACRSLLSLCGFVTAAATVLSLCSAAGLPQTLQLPVATLLEVSCGCMEAAKSGAYAPLFLGIALGWGGLSVHGQIAACAPGLLTRRFFFVRLVHGLWSGLLAQWLFRYIPVTKEVFAAASGATVEPFTVSAAGGLALLAVCVVYLLGIRRKTAS